MQLFTAGAAGAKHGYVGFGACSYRVSFRFYFSYCLLLQKFLYNNVNFTKDTRQQIYNHII